MNFSIYRPYDGESSHILYFTFTCLVVDSKMKSVSFPISDYLRPASCNMAQEHFVAIAIAIVTASIFALFSSRIGSLLLERLEGSKVFQPASTAKQIFKT